MCEFSMKPVWILLFKHEVVVHSTNIYYTDVIVAVQAPPSQVSVTPPGLFQKPWPGFAQVLLFLRSQTQFGLKEENLVWRLLKETVSCWVES